MLSISVTLCQKVSSLSCQKSFNLLVIFGENGFWVCFVCVVFCCFVCVFGDDSFNGSLLYFMNGLNATCLHDFFFLLRVWLMGKLRKR